MVIKSVLLMVINLPEHLTSHGDIDCSRKLITRGPAGLVPASMRRGRARAHDRLGPVRYVRHQALTRT